MAYERMQVIVGLTGLKAAGKGTFAERLAVHGFLPFRTRDAVIAECGRRGIADPSVEQMQDVGNALRGETGDMSCWMIRLLDLAARAGAERAALDGIRNPLEIERLRSLLGKRFTIVGVTAPYQLRESRYLARRQEGDLHGLSIEEEREKFRLLDARDRGVGEPVHGQQVDACLKLVRPEHLFVNDQGIRRFRTAISTFAGALLGRLSQ